MSQASALAEARELKVAMSDYGVRCSIELQIGRAYVGDDWYTSKFLRMHHHTATRYKPGGNMTPALYICKHGRSDVPGPLCNGYGGFDLVYRIITMGLANHPGLGGPITIDGVTVPKNSARVSTWGTEWEGGYQEWDTIPGMSEFMGRADNALCDWMGRPITSQMEHSTWTDRKIDRLHMSRSTGIQLTTKWRQKGDDMSATDVAAINKHTDAKVAALKTELVAEMEKRDSVPPFRVVVEGYKSGAEGLQGKVFHTDFCGYIQEVVNGQGLDRLIVNTLRLGGEQAAAIRVEESLLQWMIDSWGSSDG